MDQIARAGSASRRKVPGRDDRGLAIVMVSVTMLVLLAFVGLAVDVGMLYNERRQSQGAADTAALAAVQDDTWDEQLATVFALVNLSGDTQYTVADWNDPTLCPDPLELPAGFTPATGANAQAPGVYPADSYPGQVVTRSGELDTNCIAFTGTLGAQDYQLFVRVPTREVDASFASMVGVSSFKTSAFAVAGFGTVVNQNRNILPFSFDGVLTGASNGACLLDPPGGLSAEEINAMCPGPSQGSFGTFRFYRPTESLCGSGDKDMIALRNLAQGLDHDLDVYPATPGPEDVNWGSVDPLSYGTPGANAFTIEESCANASAGPNTMANDTGAALSMNAVLLGLLMPAGNTAWIPDGNGGRLLRYPGSSAAYPAAPYTWDTMTHLGITMDNMGLWEFIGTDGETFGCNGCGGDWADHTGIDFMNSDDPDNLHPEYIRAGPGLNDSSKQWVYGPGETLPTICDPDLDVWVEPHRDDAPGPPAQDNDDSSADGQTPGDGIEDIQRSWPWNYARIMHCMFAVDQSPTTSVLFDRKDIDPTPIELGGKYDIEYSPRFGWVPELWWTSADIAGGSTAFEIKRFKPMFLNTHYWNLATRVCMLRAGEGVQQYPTGNPDPCTASGAQFRTISGMYFDVDHPGEIGPTQLPESVYDSAPAEKEKPVPSLIR